MYSLGFLLKIGLGEIIGTVFFVLKGCAGLLALVFTLSPELARRFSRNYLAK